MVADALYVLFGFKPDDGSIRRAEGAIDSLGSKLTSLAKVAAAVLAPAALVQFARAQLSEATATADAAAKAARAVGVSTEALQELEFAARLSGVEINDLRNAMPKLSRRISEAAKGTGEASKVFKELGLNARELNKASPDKQLEAVAEALSKVDNEGDRARLSMKLLEEIGPRFATMFAKGADGIKEMRAQAQALGIIISDEDAQRAEKFNDTIDILRMTVKGLTRQFFLDLLPELQKILDLFVEFSQDGAGQTRDEIKSLSTQVRDLLRNFRHFLKRVLDVAKAVGGLNNALKLMTILVVSLAGAKALMALLAVTKAQAAANLKLAASAVLAMLPYLALAATIGLVLLALDDLRGWIEGEDSLLDDVFGEFDEEKLKKIQGVLIGIGVVLAILLGGALGLVAILALAVGALIIYWDDLGAWFESFFIDLISGFDSAVAKVKKFMSDLADDIEAAFKRVLDWIIKKWDSVVAAIKEGADKILKPLDAAADKIDRLVGDARAYIGIGDASAQAAQVAVSSAASQRPNVRTNMRVQAQIDARGASREERRALMRDTMDREVWGAVRDNYEGQE